MTRVLANLVLFGALLLPMSAIADDAANEALARRFYAEFNARSFNAFSEFIATDVVDRMAAPGAGNGAGAVRQRMEPWWPKSPMPAYRFSSSLSAGTT